MRAQAAIRVGPQRLARQLRAEVRAADADVHHVSDALPGVAAVRAAAYRGDKAVHLCQHALHVHRDIAPAVHHRLIGAQRHMQHRAVFGVVDGFAVEHAFDPRWQAARLRQRRQQRQRFIA